MCVCECVLVPGTLLLPFQEFTCLLLRSEPSRGPKLQTGPFFSHRTVSDIPNKSASQSQSTAAHKQTHLTHTHTHTHRY